MGKNIPDDVARGQETNPLAEASRPGVRNEGAVPSTMTGSKGPHRRKDQGNFHAARHAVLSRYPLKALQSLGDDVKRFRRLERRFRETLKPDGEIGGLLFDRFFSSYLRCVLAARLEASAVAPAATPANPSAVVPLLHERDVPTLILRNGEENVSNGATFPTGLMHELTLVQRYDRHYSREMYRALSLLLVLRDGGEDGLQQCIWQIFGVTKPLEGG